MAAKSETRKEVMASLIAEAREIMNAGGDCWSELERRYPGMPIDVVAAACCEAESAKTEAWWQMVEKTIEGEIIAKALTQA